MSIISFFTEYLAAKKMATNTGPTPVRNGNNNIVLFNTVGMTTFTVSEDRTINYLVVGGGGHGGYPFDRTGGGGGAGGCLYGSFTATAGTLYTVNVGAGAPPMCGDTGGVLGGSSYVSGPDITTITAYPGGWGGYLGNNPPHYPSKVGSGGGCYHNVIHTTGGECTVGQGNVGGSSYDGDSNGTYIAGGGGGAGGPGGLGRGGDAIIITPKELPGFKDTIVVCGGGGGGCQTIYDDANEILQQCTLPTQGGQSNNITSGGTGSTTLAGNLSNYSSFGITYGGGGGGGSTGNYGTSNGAAGHQGIVILTYLRYNLFPINTTNLIFSIKATGCSVPTKDYTEKYIINNFANVIAAVDPANERNYVFQFNGTNYLSIIANTPVNNTKTFWLYTDCATSGQCFVFSSMNYPVWFPATNYLNWHTSFCLPDSKEYMSTIPQSTRWTFYAITTTDTESYIYINGVLNAGGAANFEEETSEIQFGAYTGVNFYTGYIDDMRLYDTVLSVDQIKGIYNGTF
jgi:hypothetical protein